MKFRVTFKDPDGPYECIREAAGQSLPEGLSQGEREVLAERRQEELSKLTGRWFKYGEYVDIEIDTEAKTATVLEAK